MGPGCATLGGVNPDYVNAAYGARTADARRDATLILECLHATKKWSDECGTKAVSKPIRELLWFVWEKPRLARYADKHKLPMLKRKYPGWVPWSPGALKVYKRGLSEPLVLEHVTPSSIIVQDLITRPPGSPAALIKILNARLAYTVLTPIENQAITLAGYGTKLVHGDPDPWSRYRAAGLDLTMFRSLATPPE